VKGRRIKIRDGGTYIRAFSSTKRKEKRRQKGIIWRAQKIKKKGRGGVEKKVDGRDKSHRFPMTRPGMGDWKFGGGKYWNWESRGRKTNMVKK